MNNIHADIKAVSNGEQITTFDVDVKPVFIGETKTINATNPFKKRKRKLKQILVYRHTLSK